jgi:hypothetical protein
MSYYRAMKVEELVAWLLDNGYAEEKSGYGHISAEELASALVDNYDVMGYSKTAE